MTENESTARKLWTLFCVLFRISAVSVGGGLTMLPLMTAEFVEKRRWLTDEDMVDTIAIVQSMPGIIACNMGVLVGCKVAGIAGALVGCVAVVLPPFFTILLIAVFVRSLTGSPWLDHMFLGVRSAVCALILLSVIKMSRQILKDGFSRILAAVSFALLTFTDVNAIYVIIAAAAAGLVRIPVTALLAQRRKRRQGGAK